MYIFKQLSVNFSSSNTLLVLGGVFVTGMLTAQLIKPWLLDLSYFLRNHLRDRACMRRVLASSSSSFSGGQQPAFSLSTPVVYDNCRVLPEDIDRNGHMSNDKYLYHLNFARKNFFGQLGVWEYLWQRDWNMVVSSQSIRYRKELKLWDPYCISVRLVGWCDEDKCFYLESSFVGEDSSFVLAVHWTKYRLLGHHHHHHHQQGGGGGRRHALPSEVLAGCGCEVDQDQEQDQDQNQLQSEAARDVRLWIQANAESSKKLRAGK
jgi:hypothetical protein